MSICQHKNKELVWTKINRWGDPLMTKVLRLQCLDCGELSTQNQPFSAADKDTPNVDENLLRSWVDKVRNTDFTGREAGKVEQARKRRQWFLSTYADYLSSPEWREKRKKVFERANWVCEGCLTEKATEVHHKTYDHVGHEFFWELVAICRRCHGRYHYENNDADSAPEQN